MNRYALTGNFCKNREDAFLELEKVIVDHGYVVAFDKLSEESVNLILEVNETLMASLIANLQKHLDFSDSKILENNPDKTCNVHLYLKFNQS